MDPTMSRLRAIPVSTAPRDDFARAYEQVRALLQMFPASAPLPDVSASSARTGLQQISPGGDDVTTTGPSPSFARLSTSLRPDALDISGRQIRATMHRA